MENYVQLDRQFSTVSKTDENEDDYDAFLDWGHAKPKTWKELDCEYRCVILAEAGSGKTEELRQRSKLLADQGKPSFFIRIEDIDAGFYSAFEVGDESQYKLWLNSTQDAWFFLDSVDEARLENPRSFERALRRFAKDINRASHRAHIYLSSRPYSWRPKEDRRLLDELLFLATPQEEDGEGDSQLDPKSSLSIYNMLHLDKDRIRCFCLAREAEDVECLLNEIERANLWSFAERPFDLEGILAKWTDDKTLDSRIELLRHNINKRLCDDHNTDRAQRQPLNLERARSGLRRLAAAVILTGRAGINVPDVSSIKPGIDAEAVLPDWEPSEVRALLERGVFNDIIYGAVRFRHRDVRELLAAEWFDSLLKIDGSRYSVETLFFREQYGEKIIALRLRPILPWLILFDDEIRLKTLSIHPEIVTEGGDPSQLPYLVRQKILIDIVNRIVSNKDAHSVKDNSAIARIANIDLSAETQELIDKFRENDNAIIFLGRLVWQGGMVDCVAPFIKIGLDRSRLMLSRRVSIRAVMSSGSEAQRNNLWKMLNEKDAEIPRELLVELVDESEPKDQTIDNLILSISKLPPYQRYKYTGLGDSLHNFVERISVSDYSVLMKKFLEKVNDLISKPPYIQRRECRVSKEYSWLLSLGLHIVEKLVKVKDSLALSSPAISILLKVPALMFWTDSDLREHRNNMNSLVPKWPELNDALYWASIEQARANNKEESSELLNNDLRVHWLGHFWNFDKESLPRLLNYIQYRELQDDRLVALSTAFRVFVQAERSVDILNSLQSAVADNYVLQDRLSILLNPPALEELKKIEEEDAQYKKMSELQNELKIKHKEEFKSRIRAKPDLVRNPSNLNLGEINKYHLFLMQELEKHRLANDRSVYAKWQYLIPEFGEEVACAYRDYAIKLWREYFPTLESEGVKRDNITYMLLLAMGGLEIESAEIVDFPNNLNESQVRHALRYITWELNGFPSWLEIMHKSFSSIVEEVVIKELIWEMENTDQEKPVYSILRNLVYHATWLHYAIAPELLEWIEVNPTKVNLNRHYCLQILLNGGISSAKLAALASYQIALTNNYDSIAFWFALLVNCDPVNGIPEIEKWLTSLDLEPSVRSAQIFITTLMGEKYQRNIGSYLGNAHTAEHLKSLYVLMHRFIREKEDIIHVEGCVYSRELRDEAQDARNRLFNLLSEIPGKASYIAIKNLIQEHPNPDYRPWMAKQAYKRAELDGDLELMTAEQIYTFERSQTITPATHRQLFDLAVCRLLSLKNWLEHGNDSPWQTWQRVDDEPEMRKLITGWLNLQCKQQYTTAQESELANSQRMDIWLHNTYVQSPVPIELKLLDKQWSGPKLCERLRNQLAGDYLREATAGCGIMLLVSLKVSSKKWIINNKRIGLSELSNALKLYWRSIASEFSGVEDIEVIVIDLSIRGRVSSS